MDTRNRRLRAILGTSLLALAWSLAASGQEESEGIASPAQPGDETPGVAATPTETIESKTVVRRWKDDKGAVHTSYTDHSGKYGEPTTEVEEIEARDGTRIKKVSTVTTTKDSYGEETTIVATETTTTAKDGSSRTEKGTYETYTREDGSKVTISREDSETDYADGSAEQTTTKSTGTETEGFSDTTQSTDTDATDKDGGQSSSSQTIRTTVDANTGESTMEGETYETGADGSRATGSVFVESKPGENGRSDVEQTVSTTLVDQDNNVTVINKTAVGNVGEDGSGTLESTSDIDYTGADGTTGSGTQTDTVTDDGKGNVTGGTEYEGSDNAGNKVAGNSAVSQQNTGNGIEATVDANEEFEDADGYSGTSTMTGNSNLRGNDDGTISGQENFSGQSTGSDGETENVEGQSNIRIKPGENKGVVIETDSSVTADGANGPMTQEGSGVDEIGPNGVRGTSDMNVSGPGGETLNVGQEYSAGVDGEGNLNVSQGMNVTGTDGQGNVAAGDSSLTGTFNPNGEGYIEGEENVSGQDAAGTGFSGSTSDGEHVQLPPLGSVSGSGNEPAPGDDSGAPAESGSGDDSAGGAYDGPSGDGEPSDGGAGGGLQGAEPTSDADVGPEMASGGYNASSAFAAGLTEGQQQRGADGAMTMAMNSQMEESANVGNQTLRGADAARDSGGRDYQTTLDNTARTVNEADRQNSWGKALGDAVEAGIAEGGKAFGSELGSAAADKAAGEIFGTDDDEDSDAEDGDEEEDGDASTAGSSQTSSSGGGSGSGSTKDKDSSSGDDDKNGGEESSGGGSGGGSGSGDSASGDAGSGSSGSGDSSIGATGTTQNEDGTVTIRYGCGYSWTGTPPGPTTCPVCSRETVSTESNTSTGTDTGSTAGTGTQTSGTDVPATTSGGTATETTGTGTETTGTTTEPATTTTGSTGTQWPEELRGPRLGGFIQ